MLHDELKALENIHHVGQSKKRLNEGLVDMGGFYVPHVFIKHSFLYLKFEVMFLEAFILLFDKIFENKENDFTEFALRTLQELGLYRAIILFDKRIPRDKGESFKLYYMLIDYAFMANQKEHYDDTLKLLRDYKSKLDAERVSSIFKILKAIDSKDTVKFNKEVLNSRHLLSQLAVDILSTAKIDVDKEANANIKALKSSFSHMLHGDVLLLSNLFSSDRNPYQHKLRIYSFLLVSGINMMKYMADYLKIDRLSKRSAEIQREFTSLKPQIDNFWKTHE